MATHIVKNIPAGPIGVQTPALTHTAPSNLQATAIGAYSIGLSWTDTNTDESGVEIWREDHSSAEPYLLTTLSAGATTYTDPLEEKSNETTRY